VPGIRNVWQKTARFQKSCICLFVIIYRMFYKVTVKDNFAVHQETSKILVKCFEFVLCEHIWKNTKRQIIVNARKLIWDRGHHHTAFSYNSSCVLHSAPCTVNLVRSVVKQTTPTFWDNKSHPSSEYDIFLRKSVNTCEVSKSHNTKASNILHFMPLLWYIN
jgi:hypothetical protein